MILQMALPATRVVQNLHLGHAKTMVHYRRARFPSRIEYLPASLTLHQYTPPVAYKAYIRKTQSNKKQHSPAKNSHKNAHPCTAIDATVTPPLAMQSATHALAAGAANTAVAATSFMPKDGARVSCVHNDARDTILAT